MKFTLNVLVLALAFCSSSFADESPASRYARRSQLAVNAFWGKANVNVSPLQAQLNDLLKQGYQYEGLTSASEVANEGCNPGCTYKFLVIQTMVRPTSQYFNNQTVAAVVSIGESESTGRDGRRQLDVRSLNPLKPGELDFLVGNR